MQHNPVQTGNIILIIVGVLLVGSGPLIIYKTIQGMRRLRREDPQANLQWFSNALNFVIAVIFFGAGILFIINNLKGNPLA